MAWEDTQSNINWAPNSESPSRMSLLLIPPSYWFSPPPLLLPHFSFSWKQIKPPKLPSSLHAHQTLSKHKCPTNMEHLKKIWIPKWKAWEVPDLFTSLGSYLGLSLFLHPWCCCSFCGLFCVMIGNFSFSFFKLVRNFWMQPSFGGKRKWFLLARETNKGGGLYVKMGW